MVSKKCQYYETTNLIIPVLGKNAFEYFVRMICKHISGHDKEEFSTCNNSIIASWKPTFFFSMLVGNSWVIKPTKNSLFIFFLNFILGSIFIAKL